MSPNPRGDMVLRVTIVFGVIDTLAVMLRFLVRKKRGTKIGADDWMVMASLLPVYSMISTTYLFISKGGAGKHQKDITPSELIFLLKFTIPGIITHGLTITSVKISILLLYRRVFDTVIFKKAILMVGFLCITWLFGNIFTELFLCHPMSAAWDPKLVFSNHCGDFQAFLVGITMSNMLLDVIILCMPLPMVWNLILSTRKKLEVSGVFLLGSFTCVSSLIRILSVTNIRNKDYSYTFLEAYLWSNIEPATAIWCACLMTYRPLFAAIVLRLRSIVGRSKQTPSNKMTLFNRKPNDNSEGSDSDAWPSLGRNLRGQESAGYRDLSTTSTKDNLHVETLSIKTSLPDRRSYLPADDYECPTVAVAGDSSLV